MKLFDLNSYNLPKELKDSAEYWLEMVIYYNNKLPESPYKDLLELALAESKAPLVLALTSEDKTCAISVSEDMFKPMFMYKDIASTLSVFDKTALFYLETLNNSRDKVYFMKKLFEAKHYLIYAALSKIRNAGQKPWVNMY
tara:strand:+ start:373 stop:795 length:423 start_codon:yes stop_codon:yes gene_type:complete